MSTTPTAPLTIGGVLDNGFRVYRAGLAGTFPLAVAASVLTSAIGRAAQSSVALGGAGLLNVALLSVLGFVLAVVLYAGIIVRMDAAYENRSVPLGDTLAVGWRRMPAVIGASLLIFLAVAGGMLLLVVPGIFVLVMLAFGMYAAVLERQGPIASLRYSWQLVRGHWWRTAALLTVMSILVFVLVFIASLVVGIAYALVLRGDLPNPEQVPWYLEFVFGPLLEGLVMPLAYALLLATFRDLKLRAEGGDIAERIAAAAT